MKNNKKIHNVNMRKKSSPRLYYLTIIIVLIILISGCVIKKPNEKEKDFAGERLHFRANLTEASLVPVYPDENYIKGLFFNPNIELIQIAFIPKDGENGFYGVAGYELAYKLTIINKYYFQGGITPIETKILNTTEEAKSDDESIITILMLGPSHAEETAVTLRDNLITVSGKDFSEVNRDYTDLDLAVDKLLLILMDAEKT